MFILGLQGSPRAKGSNTKYLLEAFLAETEKYGARTHLLNVCDRHIIPCKEYVVCEKKGICPIQDDVASEIYGLIRKAEVIVCATPVFFYGPTAQLKALIDRCQALWARKYRLKLKDPISKLRRGFLLSCGATRGKNLFDGVTLTTRYFFDAVDAAYQGSLTYRGIEKPGDMARHPGLAEEIQKAVAEVLNPLAGRKTLLFAGRHNACLTQMAAAFARILAGDRFEVLSGGMEPATAIDATVEKVMAEKGIDVKFANPQTIEAAMGESTPDLAVSMPLSILPDRFQSADKEEWDISAPPDISLSDLRVVRDRIEEMVKGYFHRKFN